MNYSNPALQNYKDFLILWGGRVYACVQEYMVKSQDNLQEGVQFMCVYMTVWYMCRSLWKSENGVQFPQARITGSCELSHDSPGH